LINHLPPRPAGYAKPANYKYLILLHFFVPQLFHADNAV
jgi:hypothetical protein